MLTDWTGQRVWTLWSAKLKVAGAPRRRPRGCGDGFFMTSPAAACYCAGLNFAGTDQVTHVLSRWSFRTAPRDGGCFSRVAFRTRRAGVETTQTVQCVGYPSRQRTACAADQESAGRSAAFCSSGPVHLLQSPLQAPKCCWIASRYLPALEARSV